MLSFTSLVVRSSQPTARVSAAVIAASVFCTCLRAEDAPVLVVPGGTSDMLRVSVDLPEGTVFGPNRAWHLVDVANPSTSILGQLSSTTSEAGVVAGKGRRLMANIPADRKDNRKPRRFRFVPRESTAVDSEPSFTWCDLDDRRIQLCEEGRPVLVYNHGLITREDLPESEHRRSRACYIHPVWGLDGEIMTDDFPRDHYHHHGIFWTWPHVRIGETEYDLWAGKGLDDRFVRWLGRSIGPVAAVLGVENGWFVGEKKVMIERIWIRVLRSNNQGRCLDLEFTWIPTDRTITLWGAGGKSYGGLTMRLRPKTEKASIITTPKGRTNVDLPDTRLTWADLTSTFEPALRPSGVALFVPRSHPDYPPSWLTRHYGAMCIGWPGVEPKSFAPGRPIRLNYRLWIHRNELEAEAIQKAYEAYLAEADIHWE